MSVSVSGDVQRERQCQRHIVNQALVAFSVNVLGDVRRLFFFGRSVRAVVGLLRLHGED